MTTDGWIDEDDDADDLLPDREGDGDYAEGIGLAQTTEEGVGLDDARDLDEDVPEAGSYQHTDTEAEDESAEEELPRMEPPSRVRMSSGGAVLGTEVFGSSPVIRGGRQSGGFAARGRHGEN